MTQKTENPAGEGGVRRRLAERLDTPDDTRKIHDPQVAARAISAEVAYQPRGDECTKCLAEPRFEYLVQRVHSLGPRPLAELLADIARSTGQHSVIADHVEAFARLDPDILRILGADKFPPRLMVMEAY